MSIRSYLAFPEPGKNQILKQRLKELEGVEVTPSDYDEVLVIVTATETEDDDSQLHEKITSIPELSCLTLAFAHE